jgi:hypothetical protein
MDIDPEGRGVMGAAGYVAKRADIYAATYLTRSPLYWRVRWQIRAFVSALAFQTGYVVPWTER